MAYISMACFLGVIRSPLTIRGMMGSTPRLGALPVVIKFKN